MSTEIIIKDNNINNNEQNKTFIPISPQKDDMMSIKCLCYYFWEEEGIYSEDFYESILDQNLSLIYKDEEEELIALCLALYEEKLKKVNISVLCVKSEYQKKGIGKSLLNDCIDNCVKKGYYDFYLHVAVTNERAIKLYEKVGFEQKELIKDYYSNDPPPDDERLYTIVSNDFCFPLEPDEVGGDDFAKVYEWFRPRNPSYISINNFNSTRDVLINYMRNIYELKGSKYYDENNLRMRVVD